ncbi:MAG: hypothetical protein R3195_07520 [Gemmatimonadota bacterium]|nr:hypothetical protein [Gemmatimonadota bacterium]
MGKGGYVPNAIDRARDELFSHIRRCGVLEAEDEQRSEWFDDTIEYLGERYPELNRDELVTLRTIGERYCAPAVSNHTLANPSAEADAGESDDVSSEAAVAVAEETTDGTDATAMEDDVVDTGEVSAA